MSLSIQEAINLLKTPGTRFSGSDWKYGWPHKFYIGSSKVYNELEGLDEKQLAEWSSFTDKFFGVTFIRVENKIMWRCSYPGGFYGYQRSGFVGQDGEPVRDDSWNLDYLKEDKPTVH